jgi:hypothetical protein
VEPIAEIKIAEPIAEVKAAALPPTPSPIEEVKISEVIKTSVITPSMPVT